MDLRAIEGVAVAVAEERSLSVVLQKIAAGLADQPEVALARVWLLEGRELILAASAGRSLDRKKRWSRLDGEFARIPLGERKIGHIGASGKSVLLPDLRADQRWIAHPDWVKRERIKSFAGHALRFRGEVLGVLGLFSRRTLDADAFDWLRLFADHAAIAIANSRAFEEIERLHGELQQENAYLKEALPMGEIIGKSAAMTAAMQQLELVAGTEMPMLIMGESGTGKEVFARAAHRMSRRADRLLVKVNCASVPRELFESEFFGHVKGAFTGAVKDRVGRFQLADRGTLFLDEVGEIPLELQAKLLRVLQDGEFERVGDDRTIRADVRIIAATNRDLRAEAAAKRFRGDLYYRLGVFPSIVPPLRERGEDIILLAEHFIAVTAPRLGRGRPVLAGEDVERLMRHAWPGNVRELQHVMERALLLGHGETLRIDLALGEPEAAPASRPKKKREIMTDAQLRELERDNLAAALAQCEGRIYGKDGAAALLGIRPTTLTSRLRAMGM